MPIIQIELLEGRTIDQKRALVERVTQAVCETINAPAEAVSIIIREMKREDYAKAGKLAADK
ncbi:MAG TPA: 4-oxalocrotonate tautomerase [Firmicutes bacterium]|jgi:4-oxalocrotonate tautomerase|nr:4-oxalocrotonate tautomerase [Bacillota bacterium]HAW71851.1 4-oxalocrotonate tautomerase [Bacillota bacterium]HAZ23033.1 4-oxalocrotonate tautomerase [Bacillota bacterium]HBE07307.1 4-oxalocrotonate tautomerase [Bacillota bacterium]HBG43665.1 4-oxalocrotonate tautomerase [Bacillota bacterium]